MDTAQPTRRRGGQPGNTNALKHGLRSQQLCDLIETIMDDPQALALVARFARLARRPGGLDSFNEAINAITVRSARRHGRVEALRRQALHVAAAVDAYVERRDRVPLSTVESKKSEVRQE